MTHSPVHRPKAIDFVLGHPVAIVLFGTTEAVATVAWLRSDVSWLVPALAALLWKASFAAKRRVTAHRAWTEAWDEMADVPARGEFPPRAAARPKLAPAPRPQPMPNSAPEPEAAAPITKPKRGVTLGEVLAVGWALITYGMARTIYRHAPDGSDIGAIFVLAAGPPGAALLLVGAGKMLFHGRRRPALAPAPADAEPAHDADGAFIVGQALPRDPMPERSGRFRDHLPDYARDLLARGGKKPSPPGT